MILHKEREHVKLKNSWEYERKRRKGIYREREGKVK